MLASQVANAIIAEAYRLPETEENDQLNTQDLQERSVLSKVVFELQVELDQHEHGDSD